MTIPDYGPVIDSELSRRGWSHSHGAVGPRGSCCLLVASWKIVPDWHARDWLESLDDACMELFPDRVSLFPGVRAPAAQVSDHPHTTREDITRVLISAQTRMENACSPTFPAGTDS